MGFSRGLNCSQACGVFLDQGSSPCPLHWHVNSYPPYHQGGPDWWLLDLTVMWKWHVSKKIILGIYLLTYLLNFISWRLITLQYCSGFCHTLTWISHGFTCVPLPDPSSDFPLHPDPSGSSQCTRPEHLSHASNLVWWSVSPLLAYLFQCYSLRTPHPCLCIMGSSFIHLVRTDSNEFFLMAE